MSKRILLQREAMEKVSLTGFTLLEMLTSVSILLILAGVILFNTGQGTQTYELLNAAQRVEAELRKVQGFAIATKDFNGAVPPGGWGIHFDKAASYYIIFADQGTLSGLEGMFDTAEEAERIFLPSTLTIFTLAVDGTPESDNQLDIVYRPPLLESWFDNDNDPSKINATIQLQSKVLDTKTIEINRVGHIEVQTP